MREQIVPGSFSTPAKKWPAPEANPTPATASDLKYDTYGVYQCHHRDAHNHSFGVDVERTS